MNRSGFNTMLHSNLTPSDNDVSLLYIQSAREYRLDEVLSTNIEQERLCREITRAELCLRAGIRTSSLYNIEHCRSYARLDTIEKIARALEVPPADLLRL